MKPGLKINDVTANYILSSHPKNKAIIDIRNKDTGELRYIKIRHRLSKIYAVSLVDPITFRVWAETQAKRATEKVKSIVIHVDNKQKKVPSVNIKNDFTVKLQDTARFSFGFEWSFEYDKEKYKWVRESTLNNNLECKAIKKTGDICVARYLPVALQNEYFGIFSLIGYNMIRCEVEKPFELELLILLSLMTLLDKSNDGGWKKDQVSKGIQDDDTERYKTGRHHMINTSEDEHVLPTAYEDPIPKKSAQRKLKIELQNDQKLNMMLEKEVKRSQKQMMANKSGVKLSKSAGNSPLTSPLPTPSNSNNIIPNQDLSHIKSLSSINQKPLDSSNSNTISSSKAQGSNTINKFFSSLSNFNISKPSTSTLTTEYSKKPSPSTSMGHKKSNSVTEIKKNLQNSNDPSSSRDNLNSLSNNSILLTKLNKQQSQRYSNAFGPLDEYYYLDYDNQRSLPVGGVARFPDDFANFSIQNSKYKNPPAITSIQWNQGPVVKSNNSSPIVKQSNLNSRPKNLLENNTSINRDLSMNELRRRRLSASEYSLYNLQQQQYHSNNNYQGASTSRHQTNEYYNHPFNSSHSYRHY